MHKPGGDILWLFILLALILVTGTLLIGGDVLLFLAPRMVPMAWFGLILLVALLIFQCRGIVRNFRRRHGGNVRLGVLLFLVPVVLIVTVMPDTSTSGSLRNQTVRMLNVAQADSPEIPSGQETQNAAEGEHAEGTDAAAQDPGTDAQPDALSGLVPCVVEEEKAFFNASADQFSQYLHNTLEELVGKTVTVYGFVYSDDTFPENTVLVARMMISCCAADAAIVGFYIKLENDAGLVQNEWIRVTGTIRGVTMEYNGKPFELPILTDGMILRCDAPDAQNANVYP